MMLYKWLLILNLKSSLLEFLSLYQYKAQVMNNSHLQRAINTLKKIDKLMKFSNKNILKLNRKKGCQSQIALAFLINTLKKIDKVMRSSNKNILKLNSRNGDQSQKKRRKQPKKKLNRIKKNQKRQR
jgi:hypothetical protein